MPAAPLFVRAAITPPVASIEACRHSDAAGALLLGVSSDLSRWSLARSVRKIFSDFVTKRMGLQPQLASRNSRIDANFPPPLSFIAAPMDLAMVAAAQRNGELVAHLARQRSALDEAQVVRVRWLPSAN